MSNRAWSLVDIIALLLIPASFLAAWRWDWFGDYAAEHPVRLWSAQALLLIVFAVALGLSKNRGISGVLVDESNRLSLSRLQAALWSLILISGIAAALTINLGRECRSSTEDAANRACNQSPFDIDLPDELLVLAGIAAATLGAATILNTQNRNRVPAGAVWDGASLIRVDQVATEMYAAGYVPMGIVAAKPGAMSASLGDLVRGDLQSNYLALDLPRVQQLVLTIILAGAYAVTFAQNLGGSITQAVTFPAFDNGLNVLLGISAATYAGAKAINSAAIK
jgi:hypothetical protein